MWQIYFSTTLILSKIDYSYASICISHYKLFIYLLCPLFNVVLAKPFVRLSIIFLPTIAKYFPQFVLFCLSNHCLTLYLNNFIFIEDLPKYYREFLYTSHPASTLTLTTIQSPQNEEIIFGTVHTVTHTIQISLVFPLMLFLCYRA